MPIITHGARFSAMEETPFDDPFRTRHLQESSQGSQEAFSAVQGFLEGDQSEFAFTLHDGAILTIASTMYSITRTSHSQIVYHIQDTVPEKLHSNIRCAAMALNPSNSPTDYLVLLSTARDLTILRYEGGAVTECGTVCLSNYFLHMASTSRHNFCADAPLSKGLLIQAPRNRDLEYLDELLGVESPEDNDSLDELIRSYQDNMLLKSPVTQSISDIVKFECHCAIGRVFVAFSIDKRLFVVMMDKLLACRACSKAGTQLIKPVDIAALPPNVFEQSFATTVTSIHILSDGPNFLTLLVSSGRFCILFKLSMIGTPTQKIETYSHLLPSTLGHSPLVYITSVAASPMIADYWLLGTNRGHLLILCTKTCQIAFSTMLDSLPIVALSFSPLQPDIFLVVLRRSVMVCRYIATLTVLAQFTAPAFITIAGGGMHCIVPSQPLSFWYVLDNNKIVFRSLGANASKWIAAVVSPFLRNNTAVQSMCDKLSLHHPEYILEFLNNYMLILVSLYSRDLHQCYRDVFSLVNMIDESGMGMKTELMQYFFGLLRPIQQYTQTTQNVTIPVPVQPLPTLGKALQTLCLSVPASINKKYCIMPTPVDLLQYVAYEMRFKLDDTCSRLKLAEGQLHRKLVKEMDGLLKKAAELGLKVKDEVIVSQVLLRSVFDALIFVDRKQSGLTVFNYVKMLLPMLHACPTTVSVFLKPIYPSALSLRGTIKLDEFFVKAVVPVKSLFKSWPDTKQDLVWSVQAVHALYTGALYQSSRDVADMEYRDNIVGGDHASLSSSLLYDLQGDKVRADAATARFLSFCESNDKVLGIIAEAGKEVPIPMTPEVFASLLSPKPMGSQLSLFVSLYGYIYSHSIRQNLTVVEDICKALLFAFEREVAIAVNGSRGNNSNTSTSTGLKNMGVAMGSTADASAPHVALNTLGGQAAAKQAKFYTEFNFTEVKTPIKAYERIFVPSPVVAAVYGIIMTVLWPRTLHELNKRLSGLKADGLSNFLDDLHALLTNLYVMANIAPNDMISRCVPAEVCTTFGYNIQGTRLRDILDRFIRLYIASIPTTAATEAVLAGYRWDMGKCEKLAEAAGELKLTEYQSMIDKLRKEIHDKVNGA